MAQPVEIQIPPPLRNDRQDWRLRSTFSYRGIVYIMTASCSRPKIGAGLHGAARYGRLPLLPRLCHDGGTPRRADASLNNVSVLSAIGCHIPSWMHSPCRPDVGLHAPHSTSRPSGSGSRDVCTVSSVSSARSPPPFRA